VAPEIRVKLGRILVLALLVAGLGAYLWMVEVPKAEHEKEGQPLVTAKADDVTAIDLVYPDREIELRKDGATWKLVKPIDAKADESAVKALLASITGAKVAKTLDEQNPNLEAFGLAKPDPTIHLGLPSGPGPTILVGNDTKVGGARTYVRVGDDPKIRLTQTSLRFAVSKQPKDLRDKTLLAFQDDDVQRIDILQQGQEPVAVVRKDKDAWTVEPGGHVADTTEVRSYLASLRATRAVDFPENVTAAAAGLEPPRLTVTLGLGDKGTQSLQVGGELKSGQTTQLYARRADQPTIVAVGEWTWRTLAKDANALRDKTVLGLSPDRVGKAVVERKTGTGVTLSRTASGWTVDGAGDKPVREGVITRFLDDLRDLRGASVASESTADLKPYGLDAPDLRITLIDKDAKPMGVILAAHEGDKYFAMREGGDAVYEIRDYMYQRLDKQQADFLGPEQGAAGVPPSTTPAQPGAGPGGQPDLGGDDGR
jgi:hypothetical protein